MVNVEGKIADFDTDYGISRQYETKKDQDTFERKAEQKGALPMSCRDNDF